MDVDHLAMHLGQGGVAAAERDQRELREDEGERDQGLAPAADDEDAALNYLFASEDVLEQIRLFLRDGYFDNEVPIGVRTQDWKYLDAAYYRDHKLPFSLLGYDELYDERSGRAENYSVAENHPDVVTAMKARLAAAKTEFAPYKHADIPQAFKTLNAQFAHIQD